MENDVRNLKTKVEKMDRTIKVLVNALSKAGVIEIVDSKKKKKKGIKVNSVKEAEA
ncbi:MAG: hypothetical protein ACOCWO_00875 [Candidatus Muiribacteriaceae bacterium]